MKRHCFPVILTLVLLQAFVPHHPGSRHPQPITAPNSQWDTGTLTRVSAPGALYSGYARMVQLHNGSLFTIYEQDGNVVGVTSRDNGTTWSLPILIAEKEKGINMAVPDLLQLSNHTILAFYNPRPYQKDTARRFAIRVKTSTDEGNTWSGEQTLYKAGHEFENGCWEPSAIQLPSGEIQLFFANGAPYTHTA